MRQACVVEEAREDNMTTLSDCFLCWNSVVRIQGLVYHSRTIVDDHTISQRFKGSRHWNLNPQALTNDCYIGASSTRAVH